MVDRRIAQDFLKNHLPLSIQSLIDLNTIELQKDSLINDKLRLQITDLLYSVTIRGKQDYIYVLLEHASKPDRLLAFRVTKYIVEIMDCHLTKTGDAVLPVVYPLILYTGKSSFNYSMDVFDLFKGYKSLARDIYRHPYQLGELAHVSEDRLKHYNWFHLAALFLKHVHREDMLPFLKESIELLRVLENKGEFRYINLSLRYMMEAGKVSSKDEFIKIVTEGLTYVEKDEIMVIADMFKKEVFERGKEKGKEEGIEEVSEEKAILIAKNMLAENMSLELIAKLTGVSLKQLRNITH